MNAAAVGRIIRSMMWRKMHCTVGPNICVKCATVMGNVAMRIQVETWDSRDKSPDWESARKLVPNAMEEEIKYE